MTSSSSSFCVYTAPVIVISSMFLGSVYMTASTLTNMNRIKTSNPVIASINHGMFVAFTYMTFKTLGDMCTIIGKLFP